MNNPANVLKLDNNLRIHTQWNLDKNRHVEASVKPVQKLFCFMQLIILQLSIFCDSCLDRLGIIFLGNGKTHRQLNCEHNLRTGIISEIGVKYLFYICIHYINISFCILDTFYRSNLPVAIFAVYGPMLYYQRLWMFFSQCFFQIFEEFQ